MKKATIATNLHIIHWMNDTDGALGASCSRSPIIIMLEGVPIGVKTPPMEQAYAIISISPVAYLKLVSSIFLPFLAINSRMASRIPSAIGNIMAAVAVLLTQLEPIIHTIPMARKMHRGESPTLSSK